MTASAFENDQPATNDALNKAKRTAKATARTATKADGNDNETHDSIPGNWNDKKPRSKLNCFRDDQVPSELRSPFILTGYRPMNMCTRYYFRSAFYHNNECMNIWTHVLPAVFMVFRYLVVSWSHTPPNDPLLYPLMAFAIGTSSLYLISAGAHALNSRSVQAQHICFYFDYAAISIYTFTAGLAFYTFTRPLNSKLLLYDSPALFLTVSALISFVATYLCCKTRHKWKRVKFLIRTVAYVIPWFYDSSPFASRYFCFFDVDPVRSYDSELYFKLCFMCFLLAALANACRIPERLMPGAFDFFGNSHHLLHVMTALGDQLAFSVFNLDLTERREPLALSFAPSLLSTFGLTVLVFIGNILIVMWFTRSLIREAELSRKGS